MSNRIPAGNSFDSTAALYTEANAQTKSTEPLQTKPAPPEQIAPNDYVVKPGDTLTKIAERRGIAQNTILHDNPNIKNPNKIYVGQHLNLTGGVAKTTVYTVKRGDTLAEIAKEHHTSVGDILRANKGEIRNSNLIFPGQHLRIPVKAHAPANQPQHPNQATNAPAAKQPVGTSPKQTPAQTKSTTQSPTTQSPVNQPVATANSNGALRLGANERYKEDLLFAEKMTGTSASSLAGLVNAEAATKGGVWQADSYNAKTRAGGLTQFLPDTWKEMAETPGTYLNQVGVQKGYVSKGADGKFHITNDDALQKLRFDPRTSIITAAQYDQKTLAKAERLGFVPQDLSSDDRARYLYYAHHEGPGGVLTHLVSSKTATEEQAKAILTVRLGDRSEAQAFAKQYGSYREAYAAFAERKAQKNFPAQFGNDKSVMNNYVKRYGNYEEGYRAWLTDYTAKKVRPQDFRQVEASANTVQRPTAQQPAPQQPTQTTSNNQVKQTGMPDTRNLSEAQKFDTYANFVSQNGNDKAKADLVNGKRVILGLRQPTSTKVNNGRGEYDDRIVVMWKDKDGNKHVKEIANANTEPAAYYEDTADNRKARHHVTKADANGDGRGDLGRMKTGTHEYAKSYADKFGVEQEPGKNILRPTSANQVERDSDQDGDFDGADAARNKRNMTDSATMYFHRGGRGGFTGSAGCQTMPQSDFNDFWKSLGDQDKFQYVLVEIKK